ncbi:MAG TPA: hypothetical protein VGB54_14345 [Allosphingosinicella sp.]|jgi:hypothetical protein
MRVVAAPVLVLVLVIACAPAAGGAQIVGREIRAPVPRGDPFLGSGLAPGPSIGGELRQVRSNIEAARASGRISRAEARQLHREARLISSLSRRYGHGGLSASEQAELARRTAILRSSVNRR